MAGFKSSLAAAALSSALCTGQSADGATVRHLHCFAYASPTLPLINQQLAGTIKITNTLSFAIPAGTVYTYVYQGSSRTHKSPATLAPNGVLSITDAQVTVTQECEATYPDTRFDSISTKTLRNLPNIQLQPAP
jgi:hypothetical protein